MELNPIGGGRNLLLYEAPSLRAMVEANHQVFAENRAADDTAFSIDVFSSISELPRRLRSKLKRTEFTPRTRAYVVVPNVRHIAERRGHSKYITVFDGTTEVPVHNIGPALRYLRILEGSNDIDWSEVASTTWQKTVVFNTKYSQDSVDVALYSFVDGASHEETRVEPVVQRVVFQGV
jgi:hypothetical protein